MRQTQGSDLSEAIGSIYDGIHETGAWNKTVSSLVEHVGGSSALLFTPYVGANDGGIWVPHRLDQASLAAYGEYFVQRDIWLQGFTTRGISAGKVVRDWDLADTEQLRRSEFYNDFLRRYDIERLMTVLIRPKPDASSQLHLSIYRPVGSDAFEDNYFSRTQILMDHLSRAWELKLALSGLNLRLHSVGSVLDRIQAGVLLLDGDGKLVFANAVARQILADRDGIVDQRMRLRATSHTADAEVQRAIGAAIRVSSAPHDSASLSIAIPRASGLRPYALMVGPARPTTKHFDHIFAAAIVVIRDPENRPRVSAAALRRAFDLTEAEAQIVRSLAEGIPLAQYVAGSGISANTARWHLKNALRKSECASQVELATLALSVGGLAE